jgi:uncharacterized damage-inducible protein DinB
MTMTTTNTDVKQPEPWLRGTLTQVPAVIRAVLHALELAQEDAERWCGILTGLELNTQPMGLPAVAFHIRHIGGSVDRLLTYAEGKQLSEEQLAELKRETEPAGALPRTLLREFHESMERAAGRIRPFAGADLEEARYVGRKRLPTTVGGLLVHVADHTQRHTGQMVTTAKLIRGSRAGYEKPNG